MSCSMMIIIILVAIGAYYFYTQSKEVEERQKNERERSTSRFDSAKQQILDCASNYFNYQGNNYEYQLSTMNNYLDSMKEADNSLVKAKGTSRQTEIDEMNNYIHRFKDVAVRFVSHSFNKMITTRNYGAFNKNYWETVNTFSPNEARSFVAKYTKAIKDTDLKALGSMDLDMLTNSFWAFALEKPYSVDDFTKAADLFKKLYRSEFTDLHIAEFYAIKQMGGGEVLKNKVRDMLRSSHDSDFLVTIASGLMWMNAYKEESEVLQSMLGKGMQMPEKAQQRLHALSNGGGGAPEGFNVVSTNKQLFFDVSSLTWKDAEYSGFFENLSFQDKALTYSLAVRDENKELFIQQSLNLPERSIIADKLNRVFNDEFGSSVKAQPVDCIALSGSGEEKIEGILVESAECPQMGVLIHVARIGKKMNIKFYTLFMPDSKELASQKQQALSLYKQLSPSVSMWESSIKDTVLAAIQQILNGEPVKTTTGAGTSENGDIMF